MTHRRDGRGETIEPDAAPWSRAQRAAFAAFAAGVLASLFVLVHPWYDMTVDGSIYIVTARSLAAGAGYTYLGEPFQVRPPGFPLLLAPILATAGTDFFALNFLVGLFGAAGVFLLFAFARPRLGFWLALLLALGVWLNCGYQRLTTQIMSDVPGATLLLACLALERWARRAPSWRRELALGLCIGLSAYVRSLTILLLPAIALSRAWTARSRGEAVAWPAFCARRLLPFAAVALLVLAPWSIRNQLHPAPSPAEQTVLYSYGVALLHVDPADPDSPLRSPREILERVPLRCRQLASVLGSRMRSELGGNLEPREAPGAVHTALAVALVGASLLVLARRKEPAEIFVLASLAVILSYFGFGARLALPVYLLTLPALVEVGRDLAARVAGARAAGLAAGGALLLLMALDFEPRRGWDEIERDHRAYVELARAVKGALGPEDRIGAVVGAHYSVYLERPVFSLQVAARRAESLEAAERVIARHELDAIVLSDRTLFDQAFARYFRARLGEPEAVGPALIWRIPPR